MKKIIIILNSISILYGIYSLNHKSVEVSSIIIEQSNQLKELEFVIKTEGDLSVGKKLEKERISDYKLNIKKFNTKTPTIKKVEEAILSQYPKIILTNKEQKD